MKSKHSVQLRMIRGPQEGARITLQPGSYKLGGFESGDILLCEDNLDEKPMVLEIAQGARPPAIPAAAPVPGATRPPLGTGAWDRRGGKRRET